MVLSGRFRGCWRVSPWESQQVITDRGTMKVTGGLMSTGHVQMCGGSTTQDSVHATVPVTAAVGHSNTGPAHCG